MHEGTVAEDAREMYIWTSLGTEHMKLDEKGRFAPPPALPEHAETVSRIVAAWPEVHARTHWLLGDETEIDGADFYLGQEELGHIHLEGEAHIAVSPKLRDALIKAGRAKAFRWSPAFVVFPIRTAADVSRAEALFRLSYDRRRGVPQEELLRRATVDA